VIKPRITLVLFLLIFVGMLPLAGRAQVAAGNETGKVGVALKLSTLGPGAEVAFPIADKLNVRGGINFFEYSRNFSKDGVQYAGNLYFRSGEANVDWFPIGHQLHLSPGLIFYNGNEVQAVAAVPGGQNFTLNNVSYTSLATDPVKGLGTLNFTKVDPTFRVGFGNLVPRNSKHLSILAEVGIAYTGTPRTALSFSGTGCLAGTANCFNMATDPTVQANAQAEQNKINKDLTLFKFYPIISFGVGYKF
jgi:hypothetical protein